MKIDDYLAERGMKLTPRGRNLIDNIQGIGMVLFILLIFAIVGTIEALP
jgi:hypothetical protein